MKIGFITQPNAKGQLVIPRKIREKLGIISSTFVNILEEESGFYVYPIQKIIDRGSFENSYTEILKQTQGRWRDQNLQEKKLEKKRQKLEIEKSGKRKKAW